MEIKPLADRILVKQLEEEEVKEGKIIIPDTAKEKSQRGEVKAVGSGKRNDEGKIVPLEVKVGDRVLISKYGGTKVKIDEEEYLIMREDDVMAVIK